ncbi:hypothetical protein D2Q93_10210 [Alicyclobacillaceae bacterium I2511]|nr:hypothetical protein D2Q93_10210 [Alicyclobacillaceae bacterium I2511]
MAAPITSQAPSFALPARYMLTGMVGLVLFAVDLVWQVKLLAQGQTFSPHVIALTHLLTLAVLLSFVMGAVYQLLTVAFLIPLKAEKAGRLNFWLYLCGVIGLWYSMSSWWPLGLTIFGTVVMVCLYLYAGLIIWSLSDTGVSGAMRGFVLSAHIYLILAVTAAWLLVLSFTVPSLAVWQTDLLATHIVLAAGGFFSFLIIGFSYKLLPMFTLAHGYTTSHQKYTQALLHLALWSLLTAVWLHGATWVTVGGLLALAGFGVQVWDVRDIFKKRMRKKVDLPIRGVATAFILACVGMSAIAVIPWTGAGLVAWQDLITFYLLGVVALVLMSYAYKIVPFLIWTERYGKHVGKLKIPLMADLLNLQHSRWVYSLFGSGLLIYLVSFARLWPLGVWAGAGLLSIGVLIFVCQMFYVLDLRKLPKELRAGKPSGQEQ